jgi:uncharacterized membrane protein YgcG
VIVIGYEVISHLKDDKGHFPKWIEVVICLNHVALATNAAMNIAIYICKDTKFRKACIDLLPEWCRSGIGGGGIGGGGGSGGGGGGNGRGQGRGWRGRNMFW